MSTSTHHRTNDLFSRAECHLLSLFDCYLLIFSMSYLLSLSAQNKHLNETLIFVSNANAKLYASRGGCRNHDVLGLLGISAYGRGADVSCEAEANFVVRVEFVQMVNDLF